jgi:hypothetical protein
MMVLVKAQLVAAMNYIMLGATGNNQAGIAPGLKD